MNQGRIWCVVHPTVGLPLFLGSVAITALIVHASVLSHTTWFAGYWGGSKAKVATETSATKTDSAFSITVAPATNGNQTSFVVTLSPNAVAAASDSVDSGKKVAALPVHAASAN